MKLATRRFHSDNCVFGFRFWAGETRQRRVIGSSGSPYTQIHSSRGKRNYNRVTRRRTASFYALAHHQIDLFDGFFPHSPETLSLASNKLKLRVSFWCWMKWWNVPRGWIRWNITKNIVFERTYETRVPSNAFPTCFHDFFSVSPAVRRARLCDVDREQPQAGADGPQGHGRVHQDRAHPWRNSEDVQPPLRRDRHAR